MRLISPSQLSRRNCFSSVSISPSPSRLSHKTHSPPRSHTAVLSSRACQSLKDTAQSRAQTHLPLPSHVAHSLSLANPALALCPEGTGRAAAACRETPGEHRRHLLPSTTHSLTSRFTRRPHTATATTVQFQIVLYREKKKNRLKKFRMLSVLPLNLMDPMGTDFETIEARITSMLAQLQSECGILHRLVYKNKNQHRHCSYFQRLLKVRRDIRLLQSANLEELVTSCFLVIKGDRPKQKVHLLESLKRRKCGNGKHNFMERLLGAARLLAEMVEPILKAATEVSVLFGRTFFMGFSVTIMALLARLRVLVQQILLDVVSLFNMVSSLSKKKQSIKITHEGVEVFREFYPASEDFVILECVWNLDKFLLHERKHKRENEIQGEDSGGNVCVVQTSAVNYYSIESFIGDNQLIPEKVEADAATKEDASHVKDVNTDLLTGLSRIDKGKETVCSEEGGENQGTTKAFVKESSPDGGMHALSRSSTSGKLHSSSKKVAFVSIKNPTSAPQSVQSISSPLTTNVKASHFMDNESKQTKDDMGDSLTSLLTDVNAKDSLF